MRLRIGAAAITVAIALSVAACSSGGSTSATSPAASTSSDASTAATSPSSVSPSASAPTGSDPYCAKVADWSAKFQQFESAVTSNDPATLKAAFTQATQFFAGLKDGAPAAISGPISTITSSLSQAQNAFNSSAPDPSVINSLTSKLTPAITSFTEWIATNCSTS